MELTNNHRLAVWLCLFSATLTSIARILNATDLAWDFPSQIQAAQHLLAGKGLSIYAWAVEGDLAGRARLLTMAHFPAGYSLCAAALIAMGFSVAAVVKTLGAVATVLGWLGWAQLGVYFFKDCFKHNLFWARIGYVIAFVLPFSCTPPWQSTEIFLWAAIPWILQYNIKGCNDPASSLRPDLLAGVLCGGATLMNYAGVFLSFYTLFLILLQSNINSRALGRRILSFVIGAFPFFAFQIYINHFSSETESIAGSITLAGGLPTIASRLQQGFGLLSAANTAVAWWLPSRILPWPTRPNNLMLSGATLLLFVFLPKVVATKLGYRRILEGVADIRVVAAGFFAIVPFCLWTWTGVSDYLFVADLKYYTPLLPLGVFIGYALAVSSDQQESSAGRVARWIGQAYSIGFVVIGAVSLALLAVPGTIGVGKRAKLFGTTKYNHWPSMKVAYEFSAARVYAIELLKKEPDTVVVTNHEEWFYGDPNVDGSRITRLKDFRATYISGPSHLLIVAEDYAEGPPAAVSWYTHFGKLMRADFFRNVSGLRLLKTFPDENVKIVEARIAPGERIPLPHNAWEEAKS